MKNLVSESEVQELNEDTRILEERLGVLRKERSQSDTRYAEQIEAVKGLIRQNYQDGAEWPH